MPKRFLAVSIALAVLLVGCQQDSEQAATTPSPASGAAATPPAGTAKLPPLPGKEGAAPAITQVTRVRLATTGGDVVIEVYPEAAPNAAKRFVELVTSGFYDDTPVSRVVPGFVAQFGVNWREPHKSWKTREFVDDPGYFALERGTLAFAKAGQPNTASTQVFINYRDNNRLTEPSPSLSFWVFGKVVEGMDVVDKFAQVGDPSGGLDQNRLWADGGAYLESLPQKPTMIEKATVEQ
ncbi:MAG TPA: peptidylprolyl isomerase [Gammaproteobacteria bacterium]|nr:peptidylprolyl isomerase [Gammaproteobacteria bacterium]